MGKEAYRKKEKKTKNAITEDNTNVVEIEKIELRILRQNKVKGQYARSRTQWIEKG